MQQDVIAKCIGRCSQYNPYQTIGGALITADNCVVRRENIIEDRRGYASYGTLSNAAVQLLTYSSRAIAHNDSKLSYDNGSGTFADYTGSYSAISGQKIRGIEAFNNLYLTTSIGIQVLTDVAGTAARKAGAPRALDPSYTLTGSPGATLATNFQAAYRVVFVRRDSNGNTLFGYPSNRMWVTNTSGTTKDVALTVFFPAEIASGDASQYTVQIYRTPLVAYTSGADAAGDEQHLVYQYSPTSADIVTGSFTFTDLLIDALAILNAQLYTNAAQEGIGQANSRPPLANDISLYKNQFTFYGRTTGRQRLFFTLVSTANLTNKTITVAGTTYTFKSSETIASGQPAVSSIGVTAQDIDLTARSLVRVINRYATNTTVYAYYISDANGLPGQIMVEERTPGGASFTITAGDTSIAGSFSPIPPTSGSTLTNTSTNDVRKNGLSYSKAAQPEAVPDLNYLLVGPANKELLRIVALRDSLIIIKEEGVYRLTGENPQSFVVTPLDLTVFCRSADSVAALSNTVFMLSNQGIVSISENGVQVISRDIEPDILPLLTFSTISSYSTGCAYESERSYLFSCMTNSTDTAQNQIHIYNIFTRTWVHWTFGFNAAFVDPATDKLFFSKPGAVTVYRERKSFTDSDYADPESTITIVTISGSTLAITSGLTPNVGDAISQGGTSIPISTVMTTTAGYTITVNSAPPSSWVTGAATLFPGVGMAVEWDAWTAGAVGMLKHVSEYVLVADNISGSSTATGLTATFRTNFDDEKDEVTLLIASGGWGGPWGTEGWGGGSDPRLYRTIVPRNKAVCAIMNPGFKHKNALEKVSVGALVLLYETVSDRPTR